MTTGEQEPNGVSEGTTPERPPRQGGRDYMLLDNTFPIQQLHNLSTDVARIGQKVDDLRTDVKELKTSVTSIEKTINRATGALIIISIVFTAVVSIAIYIVDKRFDEIWKALTPAGH